MAALHGPGADGGHQRGQVRQPQGPCSPSCKDCDPGATHPGWGKVTLQEQCPELHTDPHVPPQPGASPTSCRGGWPEPGGPRGSARGCLEGYCPAPPEPRVSEWTAGFCTSPSPSLDLCFMLCTVCWLASVEPLVPLSPASGMLADHLRTSKPPHLFPYTGPCP